MNDIEAFKRSQEIEIDKLLNGLSEKHEKEILLFKNFVSEDWTDKLTINDFIHILDTLELIDFQEIFYKDTGYYDDIAIKRKIYEDLPDDEKAEYKKMDIDSMDPSDDKKLEILGTKLKERLEYFDFRIYVINDRPHYYNNYYWAEIDKSFLMSLLSKLARKNKIKSANNKSFLSDFYWYFTEFCILDYPLINISDIKRSNEEMIEILARKNKQMFFKEITTKQLQLTN